MSLDVKITGQKPGFADVQDEALLVHQMPYPPIDVVNRVVPFFGRLTVNGDGITTELTVDGSVNTIDAFIGPPVDGDLYITTANVLIADSGAISLNRFGAGSALTTGINFFVETENKRIDISTPLKTNFDFIRIGTLTVGTGGKNDAYQLAQTDPANDDGYNPIIDFTRASPIGIRLRKDTQDKLGISINDSLIGVATFNIGITGFIRI